MVYTAFLPPLPENRAYAAVQGDCLRRGKFPPVQAFGVANIAKEGAKRAATGGSNRPSNEAVVPGWDPNALAELPLAVKTALCLS